MSDSVITIEQVGAPSTATVCRTLLRRSDVSLRAKGFIANLMSHDRSYKLNMKALIGQSRDGKDATYAALSEAKRLGYVSIRRRRGRDGRFTEVVWSINWVVPLPSTRADGAGSAGYGDRLNPDFPTVAAHAPTIRETPSQALPERLQQVVQLKEQLGASSIDWASCVTLPQRKALELEFRDLPRSVAQQAADEVAGRIEAGAIKGCAIRYGKGISDRAKKGLFVPSVGMGVAERRKKRQLEERVGEERRIADREHRARVMAQRADPEMQRRIKAMQQALESSDEAPERQESGIELA